MEGRAVATSSAHAELGLQVVAEPGPAIGSRVLPIEGVPLPLVRGSQLATIRQ
jgi:hypothetical protein